MGRERRARHSITVLLPGSPLKTPLPSSAAAVVIPTCGPESIASRPAAELSAADELRLVGNRPGVASLHHGPGSVLDVHVIAERPLQATEHLSLGAVEAARQLGRELAREVALAKARVLAELLDRRVRHLEAVLLPQGSVDREVHVEATVVGLHDVGRDALGASNVKRDRELLRWAAFVGASRLRMWAT